MILVLVASAFALMGCASNNYSEYSTAMVEQQKLRQNRQIAMMQIAQTADPAVKGMAVMAIALDSQNDNQLVPPPNEFLEYLKILVPGAYLLGGKLIDNSLAKYQINNNTQVETIRYGAIKDISSQAIAKKPCVISEALVQCD